MPSRRAPPGRAFFLGTKSRSGGRSLPLATPKGLPARTNQKSTLQITSVMSSER